MPLTENTLEIFLNTTLFFTSIKSCVKEHSNTLTCLKGPIAHKKTSVPLNWNEDFYIIHVSVLIWWCKKATWWLKIGDIETQKSKPNVPFWSHHSSYWRSRWCGYLLSWKCYCCRHQNASPSQPLAKPKRQPCYAPLQGQKPAASTS